MDESMFPPQDEQEEILDGSDGVSLPDMDVPKEQEDEEELVLDDEIEETGPETDETESPAEERKEELEEEKEEEDEKIDLDDLFDKLAESQEALDNSDDALDELNAENVTDEDLENVREENKRMRETLNRMETQLRKMSSDKFDLTVKNAELEAFGWDFTDPRLLIVNKNLEKAKGNDDRAKGRVVSTLKDILEELTGEDFEAKRVNKAADIMAAAESYNNASNPNLKTKEEEEEQVLTF